MDEVVQSNRIPGFGIRLRRAREMLHLSQKDAGIRLHLNTNIIRILETEDFDHAPPATFMRGYLRAYARMLNFTEDEINAALSQAGFDIKPTPLAGLPMIKNIRLEKPERYTHWITPIIALTLVILAGMWWNAHNRPLPEIPLKTIAQQAAQSIQALTKPAKTAQYVPIDTITASPLTPPVTAPTTLPTKPAIAALPAKAPNSQPANTTPLNPATEPTVDTHIPTLPDSAAPSAPPTNVAEAVAKAATLPPATTVAPASKKKTTPHPKHSADESISGMQMALPEPGL